MKSQFRFVFIGVFLLTAAIAAFGVEITTDFDHHVDFSRYRTYSWAKIDTPDPYPGQLENTFRL